MKVFKSEAEKLLIVVIATFLGVWLGQSGFLFGHTDVLAKMDWMSAIVPASICLLALVAVTLSMPRVVVTSHTLKLKALWGMLTTSTIQYTAIQKVSMQTVGENSQIFIDTIDHKRKVIQGFKKDQAQQILQALEPYVQIDQQPIKVDIPLRLGEDIGQRALGLAIFSVVLGVVDLSFGLVHHAWHSSSENMFHWLLISIPFAIVLIYPYIKAEKKAHALASSIVVGLLFGAALNFLFLQSLRWWNEQNPMPTQVLAFTLLEKEEHRQKWQPVAGNPLDFHDGYVWVYDVWERGFNPNLKQGQTYQIAVVQGRLNDIYFPVNAFHQAKPQQREPSSDSRHPLTQPAVAAKTPTDNPN